MQLLIKFEMNQLLRKSCGARSVLLRRIQAVLRSVHLAMKTRLLKCWGIGAFLSVIAVASTVFGTHTPLELIAIFLGLPLFIITSAITSGHNATADYALMIVLGSFFYGLLAYLASAVLRKLRSGKRVPKTETQV